MEFIILFGVGVLLGCFITQFLTRPKTMGSLRVDRSDPDDAPYLFLELHEPIVDRLVDGEYVTFKVECKDFFSQK